MKKYMWKIRKKYLAWIILALFGGVALTKIIAVAVGQSYSVSLNSPVAFPVDI